MSGDQVPLGPVQVLMALPEHQFKLDEEALSRVLMHHEVKDKHVVVISIAGAIQKGKSFLLDFLLRYMKAHYTTVKIEKTGGYWLGPYDVPQEGFFWHRGSNRETTGIVIWSEAFIAKLPSNEKVAVVLMDTQGIINKESTVKNCATVLSLSTMISSILIYNLSHNIQDDDLMNLLQFAEYRRMVIEYTGHKPFQKLTLLVRDWCFPYDSSYGEPGGRKLLAKSLKITYDTDIQSEMIRWNIKECFTYINCFLMPHPGLTVSIDPEFNGRLKDIDSKFIENLKVLIPLLVAPQNLTVKKIGGLKVKAKDLIHYFKSYVNMYNSNELPDPKTMLLVTAEVNNMAAVTASKEMYHQLMEAKCDNTKPYLNLEFLVYEHIRIKDKAMELFLETRKLGGEEFSFKYKEMLDEILEEQFGTFKALNERKNISKESRSVERVTAMFFMTAVVSCILAGIFSLFGLNFLSSMCNLIVIISLALLLWSHMRYMEHK